MFSCYQLLLASSFIQGGSPQAEDGRFVLSDKQGNGGQCITNTANEEGVTCPVGSDVTNPVGLLSKGDRDSYKWQEDCKGNSLCTWEPGQKTIQITVTRPLELTEFGGEWVQMFKKVAKWHHPFGPV